MKNLFSFCLLFVFLQCCFSFNIHAQEGEIRGKVTDETGQALIGVAVVVKGTTHGSITDIDGKYILKAPVGTHTLVFSYIGYRNHEVDSVEVKPTGVTIISAQLKVAIMSLQECVVITGSKKKRLFAGKSRAKSPARKPKPTQSKSVQLAKKDYDTKETLPSPNTSKKQDSYLNPLLSVVKNPLSTFSIDVDNAAYSYLRNNLNRNTLPHPYDIRIEEMINYFEYDYPTTNEDIPFSINTELSDCPWNPKHQLALVGLQGRKIETAQMPPQNLVFLMDVSGSMNNPNKLPLLKDAFKLLVEQLRPEDRVAMVVYAGAAGVVLPPTKGNQKATILNALNKLEAGGSTAGGAGIELAYDLAYQNFASGGNNRVILATDGDFNVGVSSNGQLTKLIEEKRKTGIFLTVIGFGTGNYQDQKMEELSNHGNGNYAYIDNIKEAQKVLIKELGGTLHTIAKDVKLQLEFNPKEVQAYRLIGYVNRRLADEDFNDDTKDAGEMGAGHSVTALYEIVPSNVPYKDESSNIDGLKYQTKKTTKSNSFANTGEILTVKVRYKEPTADKSTQTETTLVKTDYQSFDTASTNLQWASTVTSFGLLLQKASLKKKLSYNDLLKMAKNAKGEDRNGYRQEMMKMIQQAEKLSKKTTLTADN
ncbi:MAG: von Willebrand factor type A domain-containing protein [Chitinophagales bacterium]